VSAFPEKEEFYNNYVKGAYILMELNDDLFKTNGLQQSIRRLFAHEEVLAVKKQLCILASRPLYLTNL
jgi:hypothetical protein